MMGAIFGGRGGREGAAEGNVGRAPGAGTAAYGLPWATVASLVAGRRQSQSSPQVGAVAEPWVGVYSSKPPRLFATVASFG